MADFYVRSASTPFDAIGSATAPTQAHVRLVRMVAGLAFVLAVLILAFIGERLVERPGNEFGRRLSSRIAPRAPVMPRVA